MVDGIAITPAPLRTGTQEPLERKRSFAREERLSAHALKEAERLLSTGQINGADATKLRALISQAKTNGENGQPSEAKRLANQALDLARELGENSSNTAPTGKEEESEPNNESIGPVDTPGGDKSGPIDKQESSIYRDGSGDTGISFKMGAPLTELQAPLAVRGHETSHLLHETQEAILEGRKVYAGIRILSQIDPHTGHQHVAGGRATVTIFPNIEQPEPQKPTIDITA